MSSISLGSILPNYAMVDSKRGWQDFWMVMEGWNEGKEGGVSYDVVRYEWPNQQVEGGWIEKFGWGVNSIQFPCGGAIIPVNATIEWTKVDLYH